MPELAHESAPSSYDESLDLIRASIGECIRPDKLNKISVSIRSYNGNETRIALYRYYRKVDRGTWIMTTLGRLTSEEAIGISRLLEQASRHKLLKKTKKPSKIVKAKAKKPTVWERLKDST